MNETSGKNDKLENLSESLFLNLIIHPQILPYCISSVESWMINKDSRRKIFETIKTMNTKFNGAWGNRYDKNSILSQYITLFNPSQIEIDEVNRVLEESFQYVDIENVEVHLKSIETYLKRQISARASFCYSEGRIEEGDNFSHKTSTILITSEKLLNPSDFEDVKYYKEIDCPSDGTKFLSSFQLINTSSIHDGYKVGELIMVVAPPKVGKSTFLAQEAVSLASQGHKVVHLVLGDMSEYDATLKYLSNLGDHTIRTILAESNMDERIINDNRSILSNIRVHALPANLITIYQLEAFLERVKKDFKFDVIIVDYDSNIRPANNDNMYQSGGEIYSQLKKFAQVYQSILLVGSQPKSFTFGQEILDETTAAESSRKQHSVDMMITFGRNPKCPCIGKSFIPLMRRGESRRISCIEFQYAKSRICEISLERYQSIIKEYQEQISQDKVPTTFNNEEKVRV